MKALFITTRTSETHKFHESFLCLSPDNEVAKFYYNHAGPSNAPSVDKEVLAQAEAFKPDLIVYIGACKANVPSTGMLVRLKNEFAPTVHLCSDAADEPWWPKLIDYDAAGAFAVQVAIDGNKNWPLAKTQLTSLTPIDPANYPNPPADHAARGTMLGFSGSEGGKRPGPLDEMRKLGLKSRPRDNNKGSYPEYCAFLSNCRMIVNFAHTGSGKTMHVKGRVIESALAGCTLIEPKGSPTSDWFTPGEDYLEYENTEQIRAHMNRLKDNPQASQEIAMRLREKVLRDHSPRAFWDKILIRLPVNRVEVWNRTWLVKISHDLESP